MASSQPTKKKKKSAGPNSIGEAAMASKSLDPPTIELLAHKDEKIICLYIHAWIGKHKLSKTLVNSGAVIKLTSRKVVHDLELPVYRMDEK